MLQLLRWRSLPTGGFPGAVVVETSSVGGRETFFEKDPRGHDSKLKRRKETKRRISRENVVLMVGVKPGSVSSTAAPLSTIYMMTIQPWDKFNI